MAFKTDKISIGTPISSIQLDVSGNVLISGLGGTGTRMVTVSADGSLGTETITGDSSADIYGFFGDGVAGNVILNSSTVLDRDMNYNNLTIHSNVWLHTAGHIVRVFGTLCVSSGGHIACDGSNGYNATSTTGGLGGGAPYTYDITNIFPFMGTGSKGGDGGRYASAGTGNGTGANGGLSTNTTISTTPYILMGGAGGGAGGPHGTGTGTGYVSWWTGTSTPFRAGTGGTGRSGLGTGSYQAPSGGGGGGGGVLIVYAKTINNQGTIHANGGNGGNGYYANAAGQGGGGGGGGGGIVLVFYRGTAGSGVGTLQSAGGTVGSNGTGGSNGGSGYTKSYQM